MPEATNCQILEFEKQLTRDLDSIANGWNLHNGGLSEQSPEVRALATQKCKDLGIGIFSEEARAMCRSRGGKASSEMKVGYNNPKVRLKGCLTRRLRWLDKTGLDKESFQTLVSLLKTIPENSVVGLQDVLIQFSSLYPNVKVNYRNDLSPRMRNREWLKVSYEDYKLGTDFAVA